jgi:RNA-directed DNA polymerase
VSAETDRNVTVTPLVVVSPDALPKHVVDPRAKEERRDRADEVTLAVARWKAIGEAGGAEKWIDAELRAKGLFVDTDPSTLTDATRDAFKESKRAESAEKRRLEKLAWQAYRATHVVYVGNGVYFRDEEEEEKADREARLERARQNDLSVDSIDALAKGLGLSRPGLRWLCFHRAVDKQSHYNFWTIPKRDGTQRQITAPKPELKAAQRWLLRNVVEKLPVHHGAHGFLNARSIATNALVHAGADVVVKVDVKDFFPTVSFRRVKGLFRKGGLPENVATLCALLATEARREIVQFRGKTLYVAKGARSCPQGAPTSPAITNAICLRLDRRMSGLAKIMGFLYTRYADDMAFSWRKPKGDPHSRAPAPVGALLKGVRAILESEGFRLNGKKTSVLRGGSSQRVTGLVINKPNIEGVPAARVPRDVVRRLKAAIFNREKGRPAKGEETLAQLKGMAAFVYMVDQKRGRGFLDRIAALEAKAG